MTTQDNDPDHGPLRPTIPQTAAEFEIFLHL